MTELSGIKVIGLYDTLTYSSRANIATKDNKALLEENKLSLQNALKTAPDNNNTASNLGENYVKVAFEDEKSGQLVSTNLSFSNLLLLKKNFKDEGDFFVRDDGVLRLNGKAQNFISGWFAKVAYDMNLLGADKDKNALVSGDELSNAFMYQRPYFQADSKNPKNISTLTLQGGEKIPFASSDAQANLDISIENALNALLALDKNANNRVSFVEYFGSERALLAKAQTAVSSGGGSSESVNLLKMILEELKRLQEELEEAFKENEDMKEKALTQGLNALNITELQEFKSENPAEYERLAKEKQMLNPQNSQETNELQESNSNENLANLLNALNGDFVKQIKERGVSIVDLRA